MLIKSKLFSSAAILMFLITSCITNNTKKQVELEQTLFSRAVEVNDFQSAIYAANKLVLLGPTQKYYYDSLANLYYNIGNYHAASTVAEATLKDHTSKDLFNIAAYSKFNMNQFEDASILLQDLIAVDSINKVNYLYDIGVCFFNIGNGESAFSYMKKVMDEPSSRMQKKQFFVDNKTEETYYYVAALNTMGFIYMQEERYDEAEELYLELFKIDPDFKLAKNNYTLLQQLKQQP